MGLLQVVADRQGAGKTYLIAALLVQLQERGKKVAYYKPFSRFPEEDSDSAFISRDLLAGTDSPQAQAAGFPPSPSLTDPQAQEIKAALGPLQQACDSVLIEAPDLAGPQDQLSSVSGELATLLESRVVLIIHYSKGITADAVADAGECFGDRLDGVVVNLVPKHRVQQINHELLPELRAKNIPVLGVIPEDRAMLGVTVQQVADYLDGRWAQEPANTDGQVDRFLIGGNIMDSGPSYFGRLPNQAVITRADRPDIQMASMVGDTKCLVLTGGSEPIEYIRVEALQREVPLILVEQDTLSTAERLGGLLDRPGPLSLQKVRRFSDLVRQHLQLGPLNSVLG